MPIEPSWYDIALRLLMATIVGALVGFNRGEHGRPAGLRTTMLVCLAAALSMIQVNLLLSLAGKPKDSFASLDFMRLPLGVLSGMGFIGAGAILRRDDRVLGVTTAATLWYVTILGLCFGGGQLVLGTAASIIGLIVLQGLKPIESRMTRDRRATLCVGIGTGGPSDEAIRSRLSTEGYKVRSWSYNYFVAEDRRDLRYELRWREAPDAWVRPAFLDEIPRLSGVLRLEWKPEDAPTEAR